MNIITLLQRIFMSPQAPQETPSEAANGQPLRGEDMTERATELYDLCYDCAKAIYGRNPPSDAYADRVADLLLGTAATESALKHRRQHGFSWRNNGGAWGLWQVESVSVNDSLRWLARNPVARDRAAKWLLQQDSAEWLYVFPNVDVGVMLRLISGWDRLAVLFARLHYIKFSEAVPDGLDAQAAYWKKYYNTTAGKGTTDKYIRDWHRHIGEY